MVIKKLGIILTGMLMLIGYVSSAQSYAESALLFSQSQSGGSSRIQAIGGAQIALGGDYSSVLSNPAGLGMYNRSELTFTPGYAGYSTTANFLGNSTKESSSKLNIPGLSFVLHLPRENNDFYGGAFGVSMTRTNDFNGSFSYSGVNDATSIVDHFLETANGDTPDQFDTYQFNTPTGLAYDTYLIGPLSILDPDLPDDEYFTDAPIESLQTENMTSEGTTYQWSFSYGGNYKDILFFGGGLGLSTLRYESQKFFSEDYVDFDTLRSILLEENLEIRGSGINATFGVIVRPVSFLQIGLSFVSPTYYQITETYDARLDAHWNDYDYDDGSQLINLNDEYALTDIVTSEYTMTTPLKLSAGMAFISKHGFISADIEMMNPAKAKYSSETDASFYRSQNDVIQNSFKKVYNYRIGGEFRHNIWRIRGGYSVMGNPYAQDDYDYKNVSISGGAGLRFEKFYIDLAIVSKKVDSNYSPYTLSDNSQPVVKLQNKTLTSMITLGFTF
ncbi:MAG TPA: hypothetical protein VGK59_06500 [Ohtaekwangia sp.]